MARPIVPKFGNWENDDSTPYTVYFEKARQTRGTGKIINPNDPEENPEMFPNLAPQPAVATHSNPKRQTEEPPIGRGGAARQTREHRLSKEDTEFRQYANSPARNENMGRKGANEPSHQRGRGSSSGRTGRPSAGSEHSFDKSPLHPHYQAKVTNAAGRGAASPAWEGKNNSYDSSHGTPGRSFEGSHATPGRSKVKQENWWFDPSSSSPIEELQFQDLGSGTRMILNLLITTLIFSTRCERKSKEIHQGHLVEHLTTHTCINQRKSK